VIGPGGEDLYNIGMVYGGGHACLLLQSRGVIAFAAKIPAQQLQRHEAIQQRITRLINCAHAANAESFKQNKMIERSFRPRFLAAIRAGHKRRRFRVGRINRCAAGWACLDHRELPSTVTETDCNIQKLPSNEAATAI
jgi:hypothetical protein